MPENEFEKQVQEKMDQFDLEPSAAVWTAVEHRIRKDGKKRFAFLWLFLFLVGSGIGTWLWLSSGHKQDNIPTQEIRNILTAENNTRKSTTDLPIVINSDSSQSHTPVIVTLPGSQVTVKKENKYPEIKNPNLRTKNLNSIKPHEVVVTKSGDPVSKSKNIPAKVESNEKLNDKEQITPITNTGEKNNIHTPVTMLEQKPSDSTPVPGPSLKLNKKKNIEWGLGLSIGRSALVRANRLFGGQNSVNALFSSPTSLSNSGIGTIRPYFSFSAGGYWRQRISNKLDILGSFNYQYLSTRMSAGIRVDSSRIINSSSSTGLMVGSFYRPSLQGDAPDYINRYHFLNLSADLSWKLIDSKKFRLFWTNGFSFNRLIGSNMLHYDYNQSIYYKDNKLLNKGQLFFKTAIDIPVYKKLTIGPFASFSLGSALRYSDSARQHYSNYGIQLRIPLNKK